MLYMPRSEALADCVEITPDLLFYCYRSSVLIDAYLQHKMVKTHVYKLYVVQVTAPNNTFLTLGHYLPWKSLSERCVFQGLTSPTYLRWILEQFFCHSMVCVLIRARHLYTDANKYMTFNLDPTCKIIPN